MSKLPSVDRRAVGRRSLMAGHLRTWNGALVGGNYDPTARTRRRQQAGLCTRCGKPPTTGYRTCLRCRTETLRKQRAWVQNGAHHREKTPNHVPSAQVMRQQMIARPLTFSEDDIALSGVTYGRQVAARGIESP